MLLYSAFYHICFVNFLEYNAIDLVVKKKKTNKQKPSFIRTGVKQQYLSCLWITETPSVPVNTQQMSALTVNVKGSISVLILCNAWPIHISTNK